MTIQVWVKNSPSYLKRLSLRATYLCDAEFSSLFQSKQQPAVTAMQTWLHLLSQTEGKSGTCMQMLSFLISEDIFH